MKASKAPRVGSVLHCRELGPVTAFQVIRTPKWGDIYLRRPTSSLYHVSTDSSTLTAEHMNNLYNNNLHLWFTDQQTKLQHGKQRLLHPQHQGRGAACTAGGFSLDSRKTQGNFHKSDKLREKYNVQGNFFLNFIDICKFKRYFNKIDRERMRSQGFFFRYVGNAEPEKSCSIFHSHGDTMLTRGAAYVTHKKIRNPSYFPYYLLPHWLAHEQSRHEQCVVRCHFHLPKWLSLTFHATHDLFHDVHKGLHEQHPSLRHCS